MANTAAALAASDADAPGRMGDVRRSNLALVLGRVAKAPSESHLTRAQIAAATGLTKASVSSLVLDLLQSGIIRETGINPQGDRGRPGVGLELNPVQCVLGMEINVDYISAGLVNLSGALLLHQKMERDNRNSPSPLVVAALTGVVGELLTAARSQGITVLGAGLAVPGLVDSRTGTVTMAPNLGWDAETLDLSALSSVAPSGVALFNEANAAALAEVSRKPFGDSDFLFVSGEVGVGGGLIIGSELFTGPRGHAGELGHVVVQPGGDRCSCGGTGCLETVAGQDALIAAAGIVPEPISHPGTSTAHDIPSGHQASGHSRSDALSKLKSALIAGDPAALAAVASAGVHLGVAVASTARLFNISSVVLSGHFATLGDWIKPALSKSLATYAPGVVSPENITLSALGPTAALVGAAGSVARSILAAPNIMGP